MPWATVLPHGSTVEFGMFGSVTVRHPKFATYRLRSRRPSSGRWVLSPIMTAGQRLELRR